MKSLQKPFQVGWILAIVALLLSTVIMSGCSSPESSSGETAMNKVVVFKSPTCGCCVGYIAELRKNGFEVEVRETDNLAAVKMQHNIPTSMESCHTALIGDYFIEGHVPIEAVNKLIADQPDIDGIALPRMPAGSPGMPGIKSGPFQIYSLTDGMAKDYMTL